ncbi:MAG: DNA recombination protein RmuC [Candidatus Andersenbacteria bacterium]|nr:DNA recombination protein RmuC [Candidatus Andersenbacteria bacterium]
MINEIIISSIAIIAVLAVLFFLLKKPISDYFANFSEKMAERNLKMLEERNREILKDERERFMELSDEKMKRNEQYLEGKKDLIKEMVEKIDSGLRDSQKKIETSEKERIGEFSKLKTILEEHKNITGELKNSTDNLKNILSNNQLRGKYGEEVAENILKMLGFVKDLDYVVNLSQDTNANRPDITIKLPDKTKINIDAKFPYQSLVRYQEVEDEVEKKKYLAQFSTDVKQKIKQVTSRDYINPEEKTLDFVILFVPNEMIFSFICDKLGEVSSDALKKKVIITGPFSFAAIARMIRQSYDNFKIQEDLHRVVGLIGKFKQEFSKYSDEFDRLGDRIKSMSKQYDSIATTRTRQLTKVVDRISEEDVKIMEDKEQKKISNSQ